VFQLPDPFASCDMKMRIMSPVDTTSQGVASSDSPSSPTSFIGSEWSYPTTLNRSSRLYVPPPAIRIFVPTVAEATLPSAFPNMQDVPRQFLESIFTEELCEDCADEGLTFSALDGPNQSNLESAEKQSNPPSWAVPFPVKSPCGRSEEPSPRMHCRICLKATCDDLTATMCGHIFCNKCITQAVMSQSKCPVCATPTLLYCLFRIDLSS